MSPVAWDLRYIKAVGLRLRGLENQVKSADCKKEGLDKGATKAEFKNPKQLTTGLNPYAKEAFKTRFLKT